MSGKMGRSGRPPIPRELTLIMPPIEGPLGKPDFASADASQLWDEIAGTLHGKGVISRVDLALLQSTCEMWGLYRAAFQLASDDPIDKDNRIAVTAYWAKFEQGCARFGLNPSDRQKLKSDAPQRPAIAARQRG